jgi:hypothetical protein
MIRKFFEDLFGITARKRERELKKRMVLTWANMIRVENGMPTLAELPQGNRVRSASCPVALALSGHANGLIFEGSIGGKIGTIFVKPFAIGRRSYIKLQIPDYVAEFVSDFDDRQYPELEA